MPKEHRLTSRRDFKAVFDRGGTYVQRLLVLKVLQKRKEEPARFAFSASSKAGKAVQRNRAKRLIREAVRLLDGQIRQTGYDAVLIARPPVVNLGLAEVSRVVEELFRKAGLLEGEVPN